MSKKLSFFFAKTNVFKNNEHLMSNINYKITRKKKIPIQSKNIITQPIYIKMLKKNYLPFEPHFCFRKQQLELSPIG